MRIAQVALVGERSAETYGGTERTCPTLTRTRLTRSRRDPVCERRFVTTARLEAICVSSPAIEYRIFNRDAPMTMLMEQARENRRLRHHSLPSRFPVPLARRNPTPTVTTFHGRPDLPELHPVFRERCRWCHFECAAETRSRANWHATVHHGLPDLYGLHPNPGRYLAFLGVAGCP